MCLTVFQDKKSEAMVLVGPKSGISLVTNVRFYTVSIPAHSLTNTQPVCIVFIDSLLFLFANT